MSYLCVFDLIISITKSPAHTSDTPEVRKYKCYQQGKSS